MKSIVFIVSTILFLNFSAHLQANEFIISNQIAIKQPFSNRIAHSGEMVIFKYKNWSYTHEIVSPESFIGSVDLSGVEHQFIQSLFETNKREKLPRWLNVLAEDFSAKILNENGKYKKFTLGSSTVYGTHNTKEEHAFIFILEESMIHKLEVLGTRKNYTDFIKNIIKRN